MTGIVVLRPDGAARAERLLAEEVPVAVEVNGVGYAVMMMTPADLDLFALGFMLTERLADRAADVLDSESVAVPDGIVLRVTLSAACAARISDRVRHRTSDTGCGLCGIAGLEQLRRRAPRAPSPRCAPGAIFTALTGLRAHQPGNAATGALHAAALCDAHGAIVAAHEDVGRHNALDKLVGRIARDRLDAAAGLVLVTSRISFEMVDKALISGASMLVGVSAATTLARDHARTHGLTLAALARADAVQLLNDPWGLVAEEGLEPPTRGL